MNYQLQLIDAIIGKKTLSKNEEADSPYHDIWKLIMHPDYSPNNANFDADIALVILTDAVVFTDQIQPICLPEPNPINSTGSVVSWKFKTIDLRTAKKPEEHFVTIINDDECALLSPGLKDVVTNQIFCARFQNESAFFCDFDDGDSLYVENSNKFFVRGVIASMLMGYHGNCQTDTGVVFIDILRFHDWIQYEMSKDTTIQKKTFNCVKDASEPSTKSVQCMELEQFSNANDSKFKLLSRNIFDEAAKMFKNLTSLEVSKTSLKSLRRSELAMLTGLEIFKFTMNNVGFLREQAFWDLENLRELSLQGNELKKVSEKHFIKMVNLKIIDLSTNKLEYLQKNLFVTNLNLESISLSDNPLKKISVDFTKLPLLSNIAMRNAGCINGEAKNQPQVYKLIEQVQKCVKETE